MKRFQHWLSLLVLVLLPMLAQAQAKYNDLGVDKLYEMARTQAFDGHYEQSRKLCDIVLSRSPNYHGVRVLKARTFAWEGKYDKARKELNKVLDKEPGHQEALKALFDVQYWSDHSNDALKIADRALDKYPTKAVFLVDKTKALIALKRFNQATETVNTLEDVNPSNEQIPSLRSRIGRNSINNTVTGSYTFETFSQTYDNRNSGSFQWSRRTSLGSVIGRLNISNRFGTTGLQPEIDWYPRIAEGFYGYLNYGYSGSFIYPKHRAGGELYHRLPYSMEGSAGFRYLYFGSSSQVTILTASLTKYYHSYYFSLRTYITPKSTSFSRSLALTIRRYMGNADNYLYISGSFGVSPQERTYQEVSGDVFSLKSQSLGIGIRHNIRYDVNLFANLDYSHQELLFSPGDFVNIVSFTLGTAVKF